MTNFFFVLVLVFLFFSSFSHAERLYTWGKAEPIELDNALQEIESFDGFVYKYKDNGVFEVWKDGVKQADFIFGFKGVFNASTVTALSTDYVWNWSTVENSPGRIEVEGKRSNFDSVTFPLKVNLVAEEFNSLKFTTFVENKHATEDVTDLEMYFIFNVNTNENPSVDYVDENGVIKSYNWNTNIDRTDEDGLANIDLRRISNLKFNFLFQDIVDNNYFLTRLYFGNLNDLQSKFPDTNGFVVGFSKGNKRLNAGSSHTIDPQISVVDDALDGYINYDNGVFDAVSTVQIRAGHESNGGGNYEWRRGYLQFDIGSIGKVDSAVLNLTFHSGEVGGNNPANFDLNSIIDINSSGSGLDFTDWNSTSFETVIDNWFDETSDGNVSGQVATAWNNSIDNSRNYLALKIFKDDDVLDTSASSTISCEGSCFEDDVWFFWKDTGFTPIELNPFIEYSFAPDLNILEIDGNPDSGDLPGFSAIQDGNITIDFNVSIQDLNSLLLDLNLSTTGTQGTGEVVINDLNLSTLPTIGSYSCDDTNFSNSTACHIDINSLLFSDGNYFVTGFIVNSEGLSEFEVSDNNFVVDNTAPTTNDDANNTVWQSTDANIMLTCNDGSGAGCLLTQYRLDSDDSNIVSFGAWQSYDSNIFINQDGNWGIDYNSTDNVLNTESVKRTYVYLDKTAPTISQVTPDSNQSTTDSTPDFNISITEELSGLSSCDFTIYINEIVNSYGSGTINGNNCFFTLQTDLTEGQIVFLDWNATDNATGISSNSRSFAYTFNAEVVQGGGGGGGGSGVTVIEENTFSIITPTSTLKLNGFPGFQTKLLFRIQNETDQNKTIEFNATENIAGFIQPPEDLNLGGTFQEDFVLSINVPVTTTLGVYEGQIEVTDGTESIFFDFSIDVEEPNAFFQITNFFGQQTAGIPNIVLSLVGIALLLTVSNDRRFLK